MSIPESLNERFRDAFNARNLDALLELYEPGAILVPGPQVPARRGLVEIKEALRAFLSIGGTLSFVRRHCLIDGDWALLGINWSLSGGSIDGNPVDMAAESSEVARRQANGDWKYIFDHPFAGERRPAASAPAPLEGRRRQFVIRLFPLRGIDLLRNPTSNERSIMAAHRKHVEILASRGELVLTGLSEDVALDGMVIVETESEARAKEIMETDPFVMGGVMRAEMRPFRAIRITAPERS